VVFFVGGGGVSSTNPGLHQEMLLEMLEKLSLDPFQSWKNKEITTGEMKRQFLRMGSNIGLSIGGSIGAAVLLGTGPIGIAIGAAVCIGVAVTDFFFGDEVWRFLGIGDDPKEVQAIIDKKCKEIETVVQEQAYKMFDLSEYCSDEELKEAYKVAILKYHPDKNPDKKEENETKFMAVFAAYTYLKTKRKH
jgi:hypothetical protein